MMSLVSARIRKGQQKINGIMKKARQDRSKAVQWLDEQFAADEDPDDPSYGAGMH
jgi:hypothetical protein